MKEQVQMLRVAGLGNDGSAVRLVRLEAVGSVSLADYGPGAHISVDIPCSAKPLRRSYSLTGDPAVSSSYTIAVRNSPSKDGGAAYWHRQARLGDVVRASLPKNNFPIAPNGRHHVFCAGGIGITPFIPMMYHLRARRQPFVLHYMTKSQETAAFRALIEREFKDTAHIYYTRERDCSRFDPRSLRGSPVGTHLYLCGPAAMVEAYTQVALRIGFPRTRIHQELFKPPTQLNGRAFTAELAVSGKTVRVAEDQTLLEALEELGIVVPNSCRVGGCGTCVLKVLEGDPDHRDSYFDHEAGPVSDILPCVSRARGDKLALEV